MNLPQLLRRLQVMAAARDSDGTQDTLDQINRHSGWRRDLREFVDRMESSERSFMSGFFDSPGPSFLGRGGSPSHSGIPMGLIGTSALGGVTQDAGSGKYCPATLTEWSTVMTAAGIGSGNPSIIWGFQMASGNNTDLSGNGFTGTASGTGLSYMNVVAGWSRLAVNTTDAGTGVFTNNAAGLPDLVGASMLTITYALISSAAATRGMTQMANTTVYSGQVTSGGVPRVQCGANTQLGAVDIRGAVHPFVDKHNFTGSVQTRYTDLEKFSPTFAALSGKLLKVCATASACAAGQYLYAASFFSGAAELSDAQVKTLLQTLGWSVGW